MIKLFERFNIKHAYKKALETACITSGILMAGGILGSTSIGDIRGSLVEVVGIVPPVLYAFIGTIIAISVTITVMAIIKFLPDTLDTLLGKLTKL